MYHLSTLSHTLRAQVSQETQSEARGKQKAISGLQDSVACEAWIARQALCAQVLHVRAVRRACTSGSQHVCEVPLSSSAVCTVHGWNNPRAGARSVGPLCCGGICHRAPVAWLLGKSFTFVARKVRWSKLKTRHKGIYRDDIGRLFKGSQDQASH